ncbi:MAG: flagellar basal body P-ring protein FlgI [Isosphaerales bacterium]
MRRTVPRCLWARGALVAMVVLVALTQMGVGPTKKKGKGTPPKVQETVGDLSFVVSRGEMKVEGVGLVVGLDNTGADPPPSWYRKQLVDEMSKAGVEKAEKLLANPAVSMVLVRLTIPIGVSPKDRLDVQVEVPPACGTKSLAGGYLLMARLREVMLAGGSPKGGPEVAIAQGPVMIGTPAKPNDPKVGRILGGGKVKKDYPFTLVIKENRESIRTSKMLETVVNERFHQTESGHQKGAATAKTPSFLELKVPTFYHQNQERFFRVVQCLQMIDSPELRTRRIAAWSKELVDPQTAGVAALKLEGLGSASIESLQAALKTPNPQVRFFCAEALAYLNDTAGVDALGETVIQQPKFRTYALAALAAMDQPASHLKLRKLMDEPSIEVRYGAFNALRTLDAHDPFLGLVRVLDEPKRDEEFDEDSPDSMALAIVAATRRRSNRDDPFALYVVDSEGPPLVHVSRTRRSEIVIFGRQQKLLPPIVLGTGPILLNAADNDDKIEVSKIVPSRFGDADIKLTTTLELAEVVRRMANVGASYPDVVAILETAQRQKNLPGELVVDAAPIANRMYLEAILGKDVTSKRDDAVKRTSGQSSKSDRRWFFGIFGRNTDGPIKNDTARSPSKNATIMSGQDTVSSTDPSALSNQNTNPEPSPSGDAKKGDTSTDGLTPPKDEAVQKAKVEETPPPRRRLFDFFRGSDNS